MVNFFSQSFSFAGRLNRTQYWISLAVAFTAMYAIFGLLLWAGAHEAIAFMPLLVLLYVLLAICTKRLHDFDFGGAWLLAWLAIFVVANAAFPGRIFLGPFGIVTADNFFATVILGGGLVLLGLLPGTPGPNRFDPPEPAQHDRPNA
jgi:uncharacterized membrane protein YhaH (DUF805 family)